MLSVTADADTNLRLTLPGTEPHADYHTGGDAVVACQCCALAGFVASAWFDGRVRWAAY